MNFYHFLQSASFRLSNTPSFSNGHGHTAIHARSITHTWLNWCTCVSIKLQTHISLTCIRYIYTKVCKRMNPPLHTHTHRHTQVGCQAFRRRRCEWLQRVSSTIISYTVLLPYQAVCVCVCVFVCVCFYSDRI